MIEMHNKYPCTHALLNLTDEHKLKAPPLSTLWPGSSDPPDKIFNIFLSEN